MNEGKDEERYLKMREFSRVDAHLPFTVRLVPPEERTEARCRVSGEVVLAEPQSLPELPDKLLNDWIQLLNAKLDAIISILTFERDGFGCLPLAPLNISGAGIGFVRTEHYALGAVLEIKLILPMIPPLPLYLYGEVVNAEQRTGCWYTGTKFVEMDEEIRDAIVKYVFKRQRELLREKRR